MVTTCVAVLAAALHATPFTIIADTLRGRVTDSAGAPLADVTVSLPQLGRTTRSNRDGIFLLDDVPAGRSTLVFMRPGFAPVMIDTVVAGTTALTVGLRATPFALDALTVTAT